MKLQSLSMVKYTGFTVTAPWVKVIVSLSSRTSQWRHLGNQQRSNDHDRRKTRYCHISW